MSRKKSHRNPTQRASAERPRDDAAHERTEAAGWEDVVAVRRDFPVAGEAGGPLRIAIAGGAYSEVVAHAKENLDEEVCGVLVGQLCEDGEGVWVHAQGAIRGDSNQQGSTHVTYTQETWEKIYQVKDRDYPRASIVGWYHTHPGFGVEFSEMDRFIQRHFFSGPAQFALVLDPLAGDEAVCANAGDRLVDIDRFWVDGRRRKCWMPAVEAGASVAGGAAAPRDLERRLDAVQDQLGKVLKAVHEDRERRGRFQMFVGVLLAGCVAAFLLLNVLRLLQPETPPEHVDWITAPVVIDGKNVQLGIELKKWDLPPEMNSLIAEMARQQLAVQSLPVPVPPTEPTEEDKQQQSWLSSLPLVILFGLVGLVLVFSVGRMIYVGVRQGAKQRK